MNGSASTVRVDLQRLAEAIAQQESRGDDLLMGPNGERGRFQFQEQLWRSITPVFFGAAHHPDTANRVALRHLEWLVQKLRPMIAKDPSPACLIALAWKAGPQAVLHNFSTISQRDYARIVQARYDIISKT